MAKNHFIIYIFIIPMFPIKLTIRCSNYTIQCPDRNVHSLNAHLSNYYTVDNDYTSYFAYSLYRYCYLPLKLLVKIVGPYFCWYLLVSAPDRWSDHDDVLGLSCQRYNVTPRCRCTQFDREWSSAAMCPVWMIFSCAETTKDRLTFRSLTKQVHALIITCSKLPGVMRIL